MESSLVSWQVENFSSAELTSPPLSPASPTLYNGVPLSLTGKSYDISSPTVAQSSRLNSRAQMASNLLNHLEQFGSDKNEINDFGMNWNEESVNLGLFEELSEIEYTPPASPKKSISSSSSSLVDVSHQLTEYSSEQISPDLSALTAEFQAILESLPKDNTDALSHVLEIAGIPTTIIDGEALVPVELDLTYITESDMQSIEMDVDDVNVYNINEDDEDTSIIDEREVYNLESDSNQGSPSTSVYSMNEDVLLIDEEDVQASAAEKILDALLLGDLSTAESFLPVMHDESSMSSQSSSDSVALIEDVTTTVQQPSTSTAEKKPERRGRKPGKKLTKGSPGYIKDKSIRKKEQNKTAATRYRQKKKMEVALTLETEAELQKVQDDLVKNKEDLHRQIVMVKQLLREVIAARKPVGQQGKPKSNRRK